MTRAYSAAPFYVDRIQGLKPLAMMGRAFGVLIPAMPAAISAKGALHYSLRF